MYITGQDLVVSITLANEITPAMLEALKAGEFSWQLRIEYEGKKIFMAHENIATLFVAMNVLGLHGAIIQSLSVERGSVYLEIQAKLKEMSNASRLN